jgi:hypothetical protein
MQPDAFTRACACIEFRPTDHQNPGGVNKTWPVILEGGTWHWMGPWDCIVDGVIALEFLVAKAGCLWPVLPPSLPGPGSPQIADSLPGARGAGGAVPGAGGAVPGAGGAVPGAGGAAPWTPAAQQPQQPTPPAQAPPVPAAVAGSVAAAAATSPAPDGRPPATPAGAAPAAASSSSTASTAPAPPGQPVTKAAAQEAAGPSACPALRANEIVAEKTREAWKQQAGLAGELFKIVRIVPGAHDFTWRENLRLLTSVLPTNIPWERILTLQGCLPSFALAQIALRSGQWKLKTFNGEGLAPQDFHMDRLIWPSDLHIHGLGRPDGARAGQSVAGGLGGAGGAVGAGDAGGAGPPTLEVIGWGSSDGSEIWGPSPALFDAGKRPPARQGWFLHVWHHFLYQFGALQDVPRKCCGQVEEAWLPPALDPGSGSQMKSMCYKPALKHYMEVCKERLFERKNGERVITYNDHFPAKLIYAEVGETELPLVLVMSEPDWGHGYRAKHQVFVHLSLVSEAVLQYANATREGIAEGRHAEIGGYRKRS